VFTIHRQPALPSPHNGRTAIDKRMSFVEKRMTTGGRWHRPQKVGLARGINLGLMPQGGIRRETRRVTSNEDGHLRWEAAGKGKGNAAPTTRPLGREIVHSQPPTMPNVLVGRRSWTR